MSKVNYNIGDHVIIEESNVEEHEVFAGRSGKIIDVWVTPGGYDYLVRLDDDDNLEVWCNVKCLVENPQKYKVGDHVIIEESNIDRTRKYAGKTGVIVGQWPMKCGYEYKYSVRPDEWEYCEGGIWCKVKSLVPRTEKIVITTDGKTTTATLYENDKKVKTATAKCSPDDKFDFAIGAKIAMDRLYPEKSEPNTEGTIKYLDCKFVLTNVEGLAKDYFTEGKVYTMTDGKVQNDNGTTYPLHRTIKDVTDLKDYFEVAGGSHAFPVPAKVIVLKEDC